MGLVLPYEEFFNTDLSRMLKQRQLPYSGTKAKMAARLAADDIRTVGKPVLSNMKVRLLLTH